MTLRQAQAGALRLAQRGARSRPAPVALLGLALTAVLLAGCTSNFLVDDGNGSAAPTPTLSATPVPTESEEPKPQEQYDCDNVLIDRPGNYVLGECGTVTL